MKEGEMVTKEQFEAVYQAYFQRLYRYLCSLTRSADLAEELTAETFLKALEALPRYRGQSDVGTWLCQIGKNCYYDHLRLNSRQAPLPESEAPGPEDLLQQLLDRETAGEILSAQHRLPEPYKEVFLLRAIGGQSFRTIGALFGKSQNWACVTFHRAKDN